MIRLLRKGIFYIYSSFTSVEFYRDVAYREKGYGINILWIVFVILFIPSVLHYIYQLNEHLKQQWRDNILMIPTLNVVNGQVVRKNQDKAILKKIQDLDNISWIEGNQIPQNVPAHIDYYLGNYYFLLRVPSNNWFGFELNKKDLFFPVTSWNTLKAPINGQKIYNQIGSAVIFAMASIFLLMNIAFMLNISFFFVYSFSFVACKMIRLLINNYNPDRKMVCRLLSVSMIPTLVFAGIVMDLIPYKDYHKYMYVFLYMLNFNIAVRLVRQKSPLTALDLADAQQK